MIGVDATADPATSDSSRNIPVSFLDALISTILSSQSCGLVLLSTGHMDSTEIRLSGDKPLNESTVSSLSNNAVYTPPRSLHTGDIIISGSARVHIGDSHGSTTRTETPGEIIGKLKSSLNFPHRYDRFEHVTEAYQNTYQWLLHPDAPYTRLQDCFATWISDEGSQHRLYWIYGKPGSGKSTIMKYLFTSLSAEYLGTLWSGTNSIVKGHHFFWSSGTILQKSLDGLYRSLIIQILDQRPDLLDCVIPNTQQMELGDPATRFSRMKLNQALRELIRVVAQTSYLLLIIDGLDECEGDAEDQDELLNLLLNLAEFEKVKICVASRAWNAPRDAFFNRPQLRLEDLTCADIEIFVTAQLNRSRRWSSLKDRNIDEAASLISNIVTKSEGVFLWVRLVVRDILQGLRDGDDINQLQQTLDNTSPELDTYFMGILQSIEPKYRREASVLFQLMLFEELEYQSVFPITLMDTIFISETNEDFGTHKNIQSREIDLRDRKAFLSLIDSTGRKLISRCRGLLECDFEDLSDSDDHEDALHRGEEAQSSQSNTQNPSNDDADWIEEGFTLEVSLLHRSLRDLLMRSDLQSFLHSHTGGRPLNIRVFLSSARALQLLALTSIGYNGELAVGIASHLLCDLWVNRISRTSLLLAEKIRASIEQLAVCTEREEGRWWYISDALDTWLWEQSNFLSLAIDFDLCSYIASFMTPLAIRQKRGRPILDYILRPRFATKDWYPGCEWVDSGLVKVALSRGSDPNGTIEREGLSVWAAFLCFLADTTYFWRNDDSVVGRARSIATFEALLALAHAGAAPTFPVRWLASPPVNSALGAMAIGHVRQEWLDVVFHPAQGQVQERTVAASDLIDSMRGCFRFDVSSLVGHLNTHRYAASYRGQNH